MSFDLSQLNQFTGTEGYMLLNVINIPVRVSTKNYGTVNAAMTDGVVYLRENANCYWLLDAIVSHLPKLLKNERCCDFSVWILKKVGNGAELTAVADSGEEPVIKQMIEYTDFPFSEEGEFKLFGQIGALNIKGKNTPTYILMLPSEY